MTPNSFIIPDISDIFQELPYKKQLVLSSTMPQVDMHGPIIVRPLPNIQIFIDTYFQYKISTTSYYIVLSNDSDTSRLKKRTKKITLRKQPNFFFITPKYHEQDHNGIVTISQSYSFNEPNESKLYRYDLCDHTLPHEELNQAHYNKLTLFFDGALNQFPLNDSNSGTYNFKNCYISSYTPAITPLKIIKRTTSSIYSVSSAMVSSDYITQTVSSTGLKNKLNIKLTKSDILIFYAKLDILF
ncbi:hypothetical protein F8M41_015482 [Gigaspora margarita]|uniref:Uncharacterized protein n=1 Tax=Gigaspora margarita TaxID=4874 RepID=A0A8H3ZX33_GIGMA|nr:hypothetical protein F8M41_015482 [Gigaspora margarita]